MDAELDQIKQVLDDLTEADVREFITEKKIRISCGECGHPHTALAFTRANNLTPATWSIDAATVDINTARVNFCFQLICTNCAHIRWFEKEVVARWKVGRGTAHADS